MGELTQGRPIIANLHLVDLFNEPASISIKGYDRKILRYITLRINLIFYEHMYSRLSSAAEISRTL